MDDPFENFFRADTFLGARRNRMRGIDTDDVFDLRPDSLRIGARQIDLLITGRISKL